jgi:hypothetical protein
MTHGIGIPSNDPSTHYDGCWRNPYHWRCAVARVEQLESELAALHRRASQAFILTADLNSASAGEHHEEDEGHE